jgi:hypothetical protein
LFVEVKAAAVELVYRNYTAVDPDNASKRAAMVRNIAPFTLISSVTVLIGGQNSPDG